MKRLIPFFLAAIMLTGCHSGKGASSATADKPVVTSTVTESAETATLTTAATSTVTAITYTTSTMTTSTHTSATMNAITNTTAIKENTTKTEGTNIVKETYTTPEVNIVEYTTEDVISTSNNSVKVNDDGSIELPAIKMN